MSKPKTYRVNVTLRSAEATPFLEELSRIRSQEISARALNLTAASELARDLIVKALAGKRFSDIGISVDQKGARIRLNKSQTLKTGLQKGDRIDLIIIKRKSA